eukprot:2376209-Alexandrium_andersonii.AAC.1
MGELAGLLRHHQTLSRQAKTEAGQVAKALPPMVALGRRNAEIPTWTTAGAQADAAWWAETAQ